MPRGQRKQFNISSAFARRRAREIARQTGMAVRQVVEEALRTFAPAEAEPSGALVRKGPLLVLPASGRKVRFEEAEAALDAIRDGEP